MLSSILTGIQVSEGHVPLTQTPPQPIVIKSIKALLERRENPIQISRKELEEIIEDKVKEARWTSEN